MTEGRPSDPVSPESKAWLGRVRANVKAQLFGSSPVPPREQTEPSPPELEPGEHPTRIGRFVVIKRIGQGGMGMVYAAYDDTLDRKVAVKLLHPRGGSGGDDARARLIREAQALARLSHPAVIHVYEVGTWQDQVYLAMEFVDGTTMAVWQRQGQESRHWREVLEAYVAAGRGLAAAHAAGIVHRDFKAANVLVRRDGAVRVVDFGLARQEFEAGASASALRPAEIEHEPPSLSLVTGQTPTSPDAPLTRTGVIMGTPAYMAPEQHLGQRADVRSDQFSYCVSLYEALYGFRPFAGETLPALRRQVLAGRLEQPPRYTDIPPRIFRVLERGLQVHASDRYPAMEPLLDELVRDPRVALRRLALVCAGIVVAALVGLAWWSERGERAVRAEGERLRAQFERARVLNAEEELRRVQSRSVSEKRDDLVLAFAQQSLDEDPTITLAALKHLTPGNTGWLPAARTIAADAMQRSVIHRRFDPGLGRVADMALTEDGRVLVMVGRGIAVWHAAESRLRPLPDPGTQLRALAITPDATRIAAVGLDEALYLWTFDPGGDAEGIMRRIPSSEGPLLSVAISLNGERVATGAEDGTVRLLDWSGRTKRAISNHKRPVRSVDFSPDGLMLATASDDGTVRQWFLDRRKHWVLQHRAGVRDARFNGSGDELWSTAEDGLVRRWSTAKGTPLPSPHLEGVTLLRRTPAGDRTLACRSDRELMLLGDEDPRPLRGLTALVTAIEISNDGTWAAAATGDETVQLWQLSGMGGDGSQPDGSRVTAAPGTITALAFSRAGSLLASATRQGVVRLWSEGGESRGHLGQHRRTVLDLEFSPQGHELAALDEDGGLVVWSVADRDQPPVYLRRSGSTRSGAWAWSPDGNAIAAPRCATPDSCEVVLYPLSGDEPYALASTDSPASALRFSPSGRQLLSDHPTGSWLWDLTEGQGRALEWPEGDKPGKRLAFSYVRGGVRMATADAIRDEEAQVLSTTLRVWHIEQQTGDMHLLLEEPELHTLLVDADGQTLLLRTHDDHTLLWRLASDHFRLLPPIARGYDHLVVSPDSGALLLRPRIERGREQDHLWIDVESGQMRRFSRRREPMAWSARGVVADVPGHTGLRIWRDPTPDEVGAFLRWLDDATNLVVDPASIR
ncbi:MAG: protein kinase [Deltaproteobacteria bacterium]|nr:protein kinase [Deltaproteobacteria bacterium]